MKQSPFKFQGNNSAQAKKGKDKATPEIEGKTDKSALSPKNLKKTQSKSKSHIQIRTGRPQVAQRPKGGG